jgi:hypothetical protein
LNVEQRRKKVHCDIRGCGKEAVGGGELRIDAGIGGDHSTIAGDLIAWCEFHEVSLRGSIESEFIELDPPQLKVGYAAQSAKRGRAT